MRINKFKYDHSMLFAPVVHMGDHSAYGKYWDPLTHTLNSYNMLTSGSGGYYTWTWLSADCIGESDMDTVSSSCVIRSNLKINGEKITGTLTGVDFKY